MYFNPGENNEPKFVVKLPFVTHSRVKYCVGAKGIHTSLMEYINNENVWGYIPYAIIQPEIPENAEVKVICFNGEARFRNTHKKSKDGRSPFGRARDRVFFDFAEHVIATMRRVCPALVVDEAIRVEVESVYHEAKE